MKTVDYLLWHTGISVDVNKVYRYLDKLNSKQKKTTQHISYQHTLQVLNNNISIVFYDVTTLYFEIEDEDDLRKKPVFPKKENTSILKSFSGCW